MRLKTLFFYRQCCFVSRCAFSAVKVFRLWRYLKICIYYGASFLVYPVSDICDPLSKNPLFSQSIYVTGFEKNPAIRLTISSEMDYWLNTQYVPCSKVMSLVSVAAFLRPCVSLECHFGVIK